MYSSKVFYLFIPGLYLLYEDRYWFYNNTNQGWINKKCWMNTFSTCRKALLWWVYQERHGNNNFNLRSLVHLFWVSASFVEGDWTSSRDIQSRRIQIHIKYNVIWWSFEPNGIPFVPNEKESFQQGWIKFNLGDNKNIFSPFSIQNSSTTKPFHFPRPLAYENHTKLPLEGVNDYWN